ncbi:hypothetical protein [Streptomyces sp. 8N706]|uniref:hypothetical protein n=1 Tax=Streptomyces sp. 8N706 TaxID=3457416 RepID=UPI003FD2EC10
MVAALDALAAQPARGRRLPVVVFRDEAAPGRAQAFVSGYGERLRGKDPEGNQEFLVPHALVDKACQATVTRDARPEIALLDALVKEWENTMPRLSGTLRLPLYRTCRDVLDVTLSDDDPLAADVPPDPQQAMAQGLWRAWERRTTGLVALREGLDNGGADAVRPPWLAAVLRLLLSWPLQLWHRAKLNHSMRWYTQRVCQAGLAARNFIEAATRLREADDQRQATLRLSLLLEALSTDLSAAVAPSRFRPKRRRRVWCFLLLLPDLADSAAGPSRQLLEAYGELLRQGARPPLLVLAAQGGAPTDTETGGSPPLDMRTAADHLRAIRGRPAATEQADRITVRVPDGPEQPAVAARLLLNAKVRPREVSRFTAHVWWLVPTLVLVTGAYPGFVTVSARLHDTPCPATWKAGKARVGIDTESRGCYFTDLRSQSLLRSLQDRIRQQNADVRGPHRTVVFLAPLTANPWGRGEQLVPAGVLQLQGAAEAQRAWNERALVDNDKPMLKMVVANAGFALSEGKAVADRIKALAAKDSSISAVIGITQSRQESVDAINHLGASMPVIGASVTGDFMADEARNFFHTQPTNTVMARAMAARAADLGGKEALIVYDRKDRYSAELRRKLAHELKARDIAVQKPWFAEIPPPTPENSGATALRLPQLAQRICDLPAQDGITLYTARGTQLPKVLARVQDTCGRDRAESTPIPVISADVNTLIEYQDLPASARLHKYTAVDLYYVSFSDRPVLHSPEGGSDFATGGDSFRAAAAAILEASAQSGGSATPSNVLQALRTGVTVRDDIAPDRGFDLPLDDDQRVRRPLFLCLTPHSPDVDSHGQCTRGGT